MRRAIFLGSAAAAATTLAWPRGVSAATLQSTVRSVAYHLPGTIGVYARTLEPGPPLVEYRAFELFPTASIVKALIMTTAYANEELTPGTLSQKIQFDRSVDLIGGSDFMSDQADGARFTVKQLIVPMITLSDNTAANMLIGYFGTARINDIGRQVGMEHTRLARKFLDTSAILHHHDNVSTPADMGRLLYTIERGARGDITTIVSAPHCREMVGIMLRQTDRGGIPAGIPAGTPVANKTGEITGTRNDIAIVEPFGDAPWILAIMTRNLSSYAEAFGAMHVIAQAAYHVAAR